MCLASSLMGVIVYLRKQSLIGEALSHAAYPGVILGVILAGLFSIQESDEVYLSLLVLGGAFFSAILGFWLIQILEKQFKVPNDAALCFVLSTFFGIGMTLASEVQFSFTNLYKQALSYLFGQVATMTDLHIFIYGLLSLVILTAIFLFYKELQVMTFDRNYAKSIGIQVMMIDTFLFFLIALSVIVGIRSVGIVLMSAMLIAPAVAARQFTHRLSILFLLAAAFGMMSGFLGNYFSVSLAEIFEKCDPPTRLILPTGPMIVLVASSFCIFALLFAPDRGLLTRFWRIASFRFTCLCENILKAMLRQVPQLSFSLNQIAKYQSISRFYLQFLLWRMVQKGWMVKKESKYQLTIDGQYRAAKIIRLHQLWEVYLVNYLGMGVERVHRNAEEMEHIITPELEKELVLLLNHAVHESHQPLSDYEEVHGP